MIDQRYPNICLLCGGRMVGPSFMHEQIKQGRVWIEDPSKWTDRAEGFDCPMEHFGHHFGPIAE